MCNWQTWPISTLLGSSTVRRLNLFHELIWKSISLLSFAGFFRFTASFCKGELNLSEHLLFRFWKLPHLQGQLLRLLLPELYVFSANILINKFFDVISSFKHLISSPEFLQQFVAHSSSSQTGLRALRISYVNDLADLLLFL